MIYHVVHQIFFLYLPGKTAIYRGLIQKFDELYEEARNMNIEGDLVLIYYKDEPGVYARIERIEPDVKKDWYQVTLILLTIPHQVITWILREEYINGQVFTMGGNSMRMEKIERLAFKDQDGQETEETKDNDKEEKKPAKIVQFKKKD